VAELCTPALFVVLECAGREKCSGTPARKWWGGVYPSDPPHVVWLSYTPPTLSADGAFAALARPAGIRALDSARCVAP
jgi:hypothetical protein